jgi:hypothetical protein
LLDRFDRRAGKTVIEAAGAFLGGYGKQDELRYARRQVALDLAQRMFNVLSRRAAQAADGRFAAQAFDGEKRLNQLSAVEFSLGAQIAQMAARA